MNSDLEFTGKLKLEDSINCMKLHNYFKFKTRAYIFRLLVFLTILGLLIFKVINHGFNFKTGLLIFAVSLIPVIYLVIPIIRIYYYHRFKPDIYKTSTVKITKDKIQLINNKNDISLNWNLISGIAHNKNGIAFFVVTTPFIYLPAYLFDGNDYKETILKILQTNNVRIINAE